MTGTDFIQMLTLRRRAHEEAIAAIDLLLDAEGAGPGTGVQMPLVIPEPTVKAQPEPPKPKRYRKRRPGPGVAYLGGPKGVAKLVGSMEAVVLPELDDQFTLDEVLSSVRTHIDPMLNRRQLSNLMMALKRRGLADNVGKQTGVWRKAKGSSK